MNLKRSMRQGGTLAMLVAVLTTYSMVALAANNSPIGEIDVVQISSSSASVLVNGQATVTGGTVFNGSSIVTPVSSSAVLNLGKAGRYEIAADSSATVSMNGDVVSVNLAAGNFTVLNTVQPVNIRTAQGEDTLNTGDSANAAAGADHRDSTGKCIDDNNDGKKDCGKHIKPWVWWLIAGGVGAAVIIAVVTRDNTDNTVVSPLR